MDPDCRQVDLSAGEEDGEAIIRRSANRETLSYVLGQMRSLLGVDAPGLDEEVSEAL